MRIPILTILLNCFLLCNSQTGINTQWTWIHGSDTVSSPGNIPIPGVTSPLNTPRAVEGSVVWKDTSGNIWIYGGRYVTQAMGPQGSRDFWKYNITTNQFTYISGTGGAGGAGVYGVKGVPNAANHPGVRVYAQGWVSASGDLYLFGGYGIDAGGSGKLNDVWKYNIATGLWTWMHGSNTGSVNGIYGTQGVPSPTNAPGARAAFAAGTDAAKNFWVYGGDGYAATTMGSLGDLWKYNTSTNEWTWISGSSSAIVTAVYGTKGVANPSNYPGPRHNSIGWMDSNGDFWLYGGENSSSKDYSDLWKLDATTMQWIWMAGENSFEAQPVFGTQGVAAATNHPGGRVSVSGWRDANGDLWIIGGWRPVGAANDLWKYSKTLNQWIWMKGDNVPHQPGVYGTKGVAADANKPGVRVSSATWSDAAGNFYLWGGFGFGKGAVTAGNLNDLWKISSTNLNLATTTAVPSLRIDKDIFIGPNPVKDILTVRSASSKRMMLTVRDITGNLVVTKLFTNTVKVSLKEYASGSYVVTITEMPTRRGVSKVIVKE